jgi:hypothetical protein
MDEVRELKSLEDALNYWRSCVKRLGASGVIDDMDIAYDMVRVVGNDRFDDWYAAPNFAAIFDLAAELEVPGASRAARQQNWTAIAHRLGVEVRSAQFVEPDSPDD